jgi:hypothetical protein
MWILWERRTGGPWRRIGDGDTIEICWLLSDASDSAARRMSGREDVDRGRSRVVLPLGESPHEPRPKPIND